MRNFTVAAALSLSLCHFLIAAPIPSSADGTITGSFVNPSPSCTGTISCTGEGTNLISLGAPTVVGNGNFFLYVGPDGNNPWNYTGQTQGVPFDMGSITLFNGETVLDTAPTTFVLHLQSVSGNPAFNVSLDLRINYVITPNVTGNDAGDADFFYFPDYPQYGSFRVLEHQVGFVTLQAAFNSLDFLGFGRVGDPTTSFLSDSIVAAPEPATGLLFTASLLSFVVLRRRQS